MYSKNKVIFFQIKDIKSKLIKIIQIAMFHFEKKENLIIQVQDEASLRYVDELLWKLPKESFLPHITTNNKSNDFIVVTKSKENLNNASFMFNLCQDLVELDKSYKIIYDFDDLTSVKKQQKSQKRYGLYRQLGLTIESK
jgi:DNA polymerase IIIc chi subunit